MKIQKKQEIEFFGTKTGNANSIALGYATETKNFGEVAVGVMNKSTAAKDPNSSKGVCVDPDATLFSVGCGGSGERKNALEVKGDGSVIIPGENGNINIADKIKQAFDTDASIELVKSSENSLQYTLMVNNEPRGSINIPKDQFLKNVTYDSEGKQLVFTFVTLDEDEHVERVPVGDLKDIYTAGEGITINGDNVISADFSSVMTAISDEKTQRETTDNEIKSILDTKTDSDEIYQCIKKDYDSSKRAANSIAIDDTAVASGKFSVAIGNSANATKNYTTTLGYKTKATGVNSTAIGAYAESTGLDSIALGKDTKANGSGAIAIGPYSKATNNAAALGGDANATGVNSTAIGGNANATGEYSIALGGNAIGEFSIALGYGAITSTVSKYALGDLDMNEGKIFNIEEITNLQYGNKKYLIGLGGYDGTNITIDNEAGEKVLNPNIKSVQQIINEKADTSAIPTKVSQLTNDRGYLTEHQSLDNCVKIGDDNTPTQLFKGQGIATVNAQQLILGSPSGGVNIQPNSINVNSSSFTFKANPTEGLGFIANTVSKGVILTPQGGVNSIGFDAKNANVEIGGSLVGQNTAGAVYNVNGNFVNLNPLYNFKTKFENSIVLNSALNNITAATTAEEVVTKFNALLADLKDKGFMEADVTA